ncbi:MAG: hypothetical protein RID09_24085 [Coleofasciculus sp. G1-WW12-02]|uniref:hypothetical protein n=1 Tax=Coleofasciculus sp. G1-WW12-02 TaxID=3068483 RepID=UPI00330192BE
MTIVETRHGASIHSVATPSSIGQDHKCLRKQVLWVQSFDQTKQQLVSGVKGIIIHLLVGNRDFMTTSFALMDH